MDADENIKSRRGEQREEHVGPTDDCVGVEVSRAKSKNEDKDLIGQFQSGLAQTMSLVECMDEETKLKAIEALQAFISHSPTVKTTPTPVQKDDKGAHSEHESSFQSTSLADDVTSASPFSVQHCSFTPLSTPVKSSTLPYSADSGTTPPCSQTNTVLTNSPQHFDGTSPTRHCPALPNEVQVFSQANIISAKSPDGKPMRILQLSDKSAKQAYGALQKVPRVSLRRLSVDNLPLPRIDAKSLQYIQTSSIARPVSKNESVATDQTMYVMEEEGKELHVAVTTAHISAGGGTLEGEEAGCYDADFIKAERCSPTADSDKGDVTQGIDDVTMLGVEARPDSPNDVEPDRKRLNSHRRRSGHVTRSNCRAKKRYKPEQAVLDFLRRTKKLREAPPQGDATSHVADDVIVKNEEDLEITEYDEESYSDHPDVDEATRICRRGRWLVAVTMNGKNGWMCKTCEELFQFKANALSHLRSHTGEKPYKCRFCDSRFAHETNMFRHCKDIHERYPLQCTHCEDEFDSRKTLKHHLYEDHQFVLEKEITCEHCGLTVTGKADFKDHMRSVHPEFIEKFPCSYCGKVFRHGPNLNRHLKMHTGDRPHKCHLCDAAFIERRSLRMHLIKAHNNDPDSQAIYDVAQKYVCTTCHKEFLTKANLQTHQRIHTNEQPYACSYCGKRFNVKSNLVRHERIHRGEKRFQCPDCGKRFSENRSMIVHRRLHTGEKPYKCGTCGKCFSQLSSLNTHMPSHTKERNYKCDACPATFLRRAHLTVHAKKHLSPPQLPCTHCELRFYRKSDLSRHMSTHAQPSYECELCHEQFSELSEVNKHMLTHANEDTEVSILGIGGANGNEIKLEPVSENQLAAQGIISLATSASLGSIPVTMETDQNCTSLIMEANQNISDTLVEDIQRALAEEGACGQWQVTAGEQGSGVHEFRLERIGTPVKTEHRG